MNWAMLRAGRSEPGPTHRHQVAHMAARAVKTALQNRMLLDGREPPLQGTLETLETLRMENRPDSKPIQARRLRTLTANEHRWRFEGEGTPSMTEMLQTVRDAAAALDTIRKRGSRTSYYPGTGIAKLKANLATRAGYLADPIREFETVRRLR